MQMAKSFLENIIDVVCIHFLQTYDKSRINTSFIDTLFLVAPPIENKIPFSKATIFEHLLGGIKNLNPGTQSE